MKGRLGLVVLTLLCTAAVTGPAPLTVLGGRSDGLVPAVEGSVRGRPVWFDLDTGAPHSIFDRSLVRNLNLPSEGATTVRGAGAGNVAALRLKTIGVRLGDVTFYARRPLAVDLSNVGSSLRHGGILGFDFFSRYIVQIDFTSYRIILYEPRSYRYTGKGVAIPLVIKSPRAYVNAIVSACGVTPRSDLLRFDLGSSDAVDDDVVLLSAAPKRVISSGVGIGTRYTSYLGTVEAARIGPFVLHDLPSATGGVQLIGDAVWHRFNMVVDFSRSVMYLTPR